MIITISGKPGSGKNTVAEILAKKLNLKHHAIGDLQKGLAKEKGLTINEWAEIEEKDPSIDHEIDEKQRELGKEDNIIVNSRIGFHFIPNSTKVYLDVDFEEGAKRILKRQGGASLEKTKEEIKRRMELEKRFSRFYGINHLDKNNYDLWLDTTNITAEQAAEKIIEFLKNRKL